MKTDLATSITAAIVGIVAAYFICNFILPPVADVEFQTLGSDVTYILDQPDPEVFNYRAINPTVEVYVGQCAEYNEYGECIENIEAVEDETIVLEENENADQDSDNNQTDQNGQTEVNGETQNGTSN